MKVCIVADVLGEPNNGTTLACLNLINYLKGAGHEVRVLCPDKDKMDKEGFFIVPTLSLGPINPYLAKNGVSLAKPKEEVIKRALDGVDVCHLMTPFMLARAALRACLKKNIPVTAGFHCQAQNFSAHIKLMNCAVANRIIYHNFYNTFYKYVDAVHYPTQFIKDLFEGVVKKETNGYVISNGVNDIFKKTNAEKNPCQILFSGRYSKEKSHGTLLRAVAKSRYRDRITLVLAGQGPREKQIRRLVKKLKLERVVMKFYSRDELVKVINESTLYVHAAKVEIEAISCLEAISCGLVPVISDSPDSATSAFALDSRNMFRFGDSDDLAAKIDYWLDNPSEMAKCSESYLGYTEQFGQAECMAKMERMLEEVIAKHNEK